ncbi:XRE family transcriptional regulator [Rhodoglobus aureus]|uniref:Cupin domain-containing protein n=1 Tax=Rhodoglobus aureus TaxID=191497 RepID=A0ABN1VM91_9MICO
MADNETDSDWSAAGERIRLARESAGMSVRELSRRIGVSASHVSQVERGLASFSVRTLYNVVSVLGISMDSLFGEVLSGGGDLEVLGDGSTVTSSETPLDQAGIVLRGASRPTINLHSGPRWERLTAKPEVGTEFIEVIYEAAPGSEPPTDFIRHNGREYGIIISGSLNAQVGFGVAEMHPGDSIAFDSSTPHRFWNSRATPVVAVWFVLDAVGPQDPFGSKTESDGYHHGL